MKKTVKENISEMKKIVKKMPTTINEVLDFNGGETDVDDFSADESEYAEPEFNEEIVTKDNAPTDASALIDDIRKKALRAMADLADTPEDKNYIMLKKVWQLVDKKPEEQTGFGGQGIKIEK